jgi:uncharacterized membrane protein YhaH (DUF805 family)
LAADPVFPFRIDIEGGPTMKRNRVIYWIATGLVCAVMVYSAINFNLKNPLGPMKGAFRHLGYPDYFRIELTVAKVLGVLALLVPGLPIKVREFAYAGFAITLISAAISHFGVGDAWFFVVDPLFFLAALITSYVYFQRLHRPERAGELPAAVAMRKSA